MRREEDGGAEVGEEVVQAGAGGWVDGGEGAVFLGGGGCGEGVALLLGLLEEEGAV